MPFMEAGRPCMDSRLTSQRMQGAAGEEGDPEGGGSLQLRAITGKYSGASPQQAALPAAGNKCLCPQVGIYLVTTVFSTICRARTQIFFSHTIEKVDRDMNPGAAIDNAFHYCDKVNARPLGG